MIPELLENALKQIYQNALELTHPRALTERALKFAPARVGSKLGLFAFGKCAALMMEGAMRAGLRPMGGALVLPEYDAPSDALKNFCAQYAIPILKSSHPLPTEKTIEATSRFIAELQRLDPQVDEFLFFLSGGASSLFEKLKPEILLKDFVSGTQRLLAGGATIQELNSWRAERSLVKSGGLGNFFHKPAKCFVLSDVPGNSLAFIGSGPLYGAKQVKHVFVGKPDVFLDSAIQAAKKLLPKMNVNPIRDIVTEPIEKYIARYADWVEGSKGHFICIAVGEPTIDTGGRSLGHGGRSQHLALALQVELQKRASLRSSFPKWTALFAASDGRDGSSPVAGAWTSSALPLQESAANALSALDSGTYFAAIKQQITAPYLGNNLLDLHLIAVQAI